jgi:uncharacterized protein YndB with AHSA1/START domain
VARATESVAVERELLIAASPETVVASGEYVELDPPRRLVFTWGWEGNEAVAPGSSTVSFELVAEGDGTRLHFVHSGLPTDEARASHGHGWDHYFARLVTAAETGDAGVDPWVEGGMS